MEWNQQGLTTACVVLSLIGLVHIIIGAIVIRKQEIDFQKINPTTIYLGPHIFKGDQAKNIGRTYIFIGSVLILGALIILAGHLFSELLYVIGLFVVFLGAGVGVAILMLVVSDRW